MENIVFYRTYFDQEECTFYTEGEFDLNIAKIIFNNKKKSANVSNVRLVKETTIREVIS